MKINFANKQMVVADDEMRMTLRMGDRAARSNSPVLICGPSGTGKELIARYIHERSDRGNRAFVSMNCAAIPEGLLESELFGFERGAFTGASNRREGKFELADGGTLLLDEVSEMPLNLQAKLLRVLQEGEVDRLGGKSPVRVNVRIIATTNREPSSLLSGNIFRRDLYYRLNVIRINCMPLWGRKEAIRNLSMVFIEDLREATGNEDLELSSCAWKKLFEHRWPGNIRELQNCIERVAWMVEPGCHTVSGELLEFLEQEQPEKNSGSLMSLQSIEQNQIEKVLRHTRGNRTRAAMILGISVRTLRNKLKVYGTVG